MRRWIERFRAMRVFARHWPPAAPDEPAWHAEDAEAWERFLRTKTGRKMLLTMRYKEQVGNGTAVLAPQRGDFARGFAAGQRAAFAWLHVLSQGGIDSAETGGSGRGESDLADELSP